MALKNHIEDLITAYKAKPNSEWRNKVVSHLKDAYAAAVVEEQKDPAFRSDQDINSLEKVASQSCTCPHPGVHSKSCPIHASDV